MKRRHKGRTIWRTKSKCEDCPFAKRGAGLHLRRTLRPGRWREILSDLAHQEHFYCHKTTDETGDGSKLVCAGSIEWQEQRGYSSQFVRICERLDAWAEQRKREAHV